MPVHQASGSVAREEVQWGQPWASALIQEVHEPILTPDRRWEHIHQHMQRGGWNVGTFLRKLFAIPGPKELSRSQQHAQLVSSFLRGAPNQTVSADEVVELMYISKDSAPKVIRQHPGKSVQKNRPDASKMARSRLAIRKVEGYVNTSSAQISSMDRGFHLTKEQTMWDFIHGFSLAKAILPIKLKAGVLLRILAAATLPPLLSDKLRPSAANPSPYASHLARPVIPGSGGNRRDPLVIIIITLFMLMYARNLHFSVFRKIVGIWLFSNNASASVFSVLSRIGLSSSYTTILKTLRALSQSAQSIVRQKARLRA
ncbi:hypothetical protein GGX14DRAFT_555201 [Mycena pura]|uniref:Uncharacterized protein n=1 Tax=Mycena pura TaxID=153505 RepID=A0AAD6YTY2_9AGAR|nr:hypothetical protein GGX14DRAFT_555201 [Mycena pura]